MIPDWLLEIHGKLWGRKDFSDQIFRTVQLTQTDFIELQLQLEKRNSSRSSGSYVAADVLAVKSDFLRSRNPVNAGADPRLTKSDTGSNTNLEPPVAIDNTSMHVAPSNLADAMDVDSGADSDLSDADADTDSNVSDADFGAFADSPAYIHADAAELSKRPTAILPRIVRYMDLTPFGLKELDRVPHMMLIRDEWEALVNITKARLQGVRGSAIITGQPGIGEHCNYIALRSLFQLTEYISKAKLVFCFTFSSIVSLKPGRSCFRPRMDMSSSLTTRCCSGRERWSFPEMTFLHLSMQMVNHANPTTIYSILAIFEYC
jgi:hypothetical protein